MRIRAPFGTSQVSGSFGSITMARSAQGLYVRERSVPVNPNTARQQAIRSAMSDNSNAWVVTLTPTQRAEWDAYAASTPVTGPFGDPEFLNGRNMFIRSNNFRESIGVPATLTAPVTPGVGVPCDFVLTGSTADGVEIQGASPTLNPGAICSVLIGLPQNQSRNFYKSPFTFVVGINSTTVFPLLIKPPAEVFVGQRYFVSNRFFGEDGKVSNKRSFQVDILA